MPKRLISNFQMRSFLSSRLLRNTYCVLQYNIGSRQCSRSSKTVTNKNQVTNENPELGDIGSKYQVFKDEDSDIILDVTEERLKYASLLESKELEVYDPFHGLSLERGKYGVFDIEDLVDVLKRENAENIFVATVDPAIKYVDYICIVNGKSIRHITAIAQFVRRVFKQKKHARDIVPRLEGADSKDWMALDLGNIALHIFSREARKLYDLESLWSVGSEFDSEYLKKDAVVEMLQKHSVYLQDLQPAS